VSTAQRNAEPAPHDPAELDSDTARRRLRNGLISLVLLVAVVGGLLLAVPGLHGVAHTVTHMRTGWVLAAVGLEILSCLGYVLAFLQVFERAPARFGARVALTELAFNAAVSLGGAGSVAVGAWLLVERGAPVARVAQRSAVLFLLTSAINVITLVLAGFALWLGLLPGPDNALLGLIPAAVGIVAFVFFLALPRLMERGPLRRRLPPRVETVLETTASSIRDTRDLLRHPDWRIIGAIAYLWCDIAVLIACFAAAGASLELAALVLAYQIAYLSNLLPIPGGIGVLDGSMVGALVLYGAGATPAAAATLVYHAISLWIPAVWGTVAFVMLRRHRGEPLRLRPPRSARA
jgi:uncharacterized membrane protein YbhN (UPF0104 family)